MAQLKGTPPSLVCSAAQLQQQQMAANANNGEHFKPPDFLKFWSRPLPILLHCLPGRPPKGKRRSHSASTSVVSTPVRPTALDFDSDMGSTHRVP